MTYDETRIPMQDSQLDEALASLRADSPVDGVDWAALRASVNERAALPLARRRSALRAAEAPAAPAARHAPRRLPGWLRPALPLAVAAGLGAITWAAGLPPFERPEEGAVVATPYAPALTAEDVLEAQLSDGEFHLLVTGRSNPDALLLLALGEN